MNNIIPQFSIILLLYIFLRLLKIINSTYGFSAKKLFKILISLLIQIHNMNSLSKLSIENYRRL